MLQRQVKCLLSVMVLLLSKTSLIFRWKKWGSFACKTAVAWKKMLFACMVSCTLLPALLSFQSGLAFFYCQPTAGKVLFLPVYCEPWQSCWFSFYASIYPGVQREVAAGVCSLWRRLLPYPGDFGEERLHAHVVCALVQLLSKVQQPPIYAQGA